MWGALQTISAKYPSLKLSITLPVMPDGLTADGKKVVQAAKNAGLNFLVNLMTMDYGVRINYDNGLNTYITRYNKYIRP